MGFSRQEYWGRVPFPSPGVLPDPGIKPASLVSPALAGWFISRLEKEMATHSSILAWKIPWMEEPGVLQFMGSQSGTRLSDFTHSLTHSAYKLNKQGDNIQP